MFRAGRASEAPSKKQWKETNETALGSTSKAREPTWYHTTDQEVELVDSMAETLTTCGDGCGWVAGIVAALAYGSFGVPVRQTKHIDVHPLVLQSFKTITMFALSWGVLLLGVEPSWTWWGLLSGFLWVVGGTGGIAAIRMAGLAIAVGTWASVMILVNFVWGIMVFHEPINDVKSAILAFLLLTLGLVGMSIFAAPNDAKKKQDLEVEMERSGRSEPERSAEEGGGTSSYTNMDSIVGKVQSADATQRPVEDAGEANYVNLYGIQLTKRQAGIAGAVFNGVMTGSSLIPLHYAKAQGYGGANYMLSMAGGALISNGFLWVAMYLYQCYQLVDLSFDELSSVSSLSDSLSTGQLAYESTQPLIRRAYDAMPLWHFSKLVRPGVAAGVLLTAAMFGSILSVTYLGQGIGNSIVQTKILVSGLWGIFWFSEIRGASVIAKWFLSASLTVAGIVWLSHERILATNNESSSEDDR